MSQLQRFGVSIEEDLLLKFDKHIHQKGYSNRSEAIRDLIRDLLVHEEWASDQETVGTVTMIYDHHTRDLAAKLTHLQHNFTGAVLSVLHVHLDHHNCLEVLVVKGRSKQLQDLANQIVSTKGVKHGKLTMTTTGIAIPSKTEPHSH